MDLIKVLGITYIFEFLALLCERLMDVHSDRVRLEAVNAINDIIKQDPWIITDDIWDKMKNRCRDRKVKFIKKMNDEIINYGLKLH